MKALLTSLLLFTLLFIQQPVSAQHPPFYNEIQNFKKQDSASFPPANAILFVGSSSFRMWKDVQSDFPGYTIINRGFGGSNLVDVNRFTEDIIIPYKPKQVVIYCGDNDLASSDTITPLHVFNRFKSLFTEIRTALPKTKISFVSIKPSPSRDHLLKKMKESNALVKSFLAKQKNTSYIDVFTPMLDKSGKQKPELFLEDMLHMKPAGYAIWQKAIKPHLLK